ncbi:MAG: glycosyl hydrolase family 88 [Clostridiales bacterium]|nr:glycosyl hydrolase family 88 [Clostridiales bacterium]
MLYWTRQTAKAMMTRPSQYRKWCYENGVAMRALWMAAERCGDEDMRRFAVKYTNQYILPDGSIPTYPADTCNLDMLCWGALLPRLYEYTGDERYKAAGKLLAKQISHQPRTEQGGFWHKKIYENQMWLDGIYMGCPFMVRMASFLDMPELYDEAAKQMTLCFEKTFDEASGLCRHAWDSEKTQHWADPVTGQSPHVWGRAVGWFTVAHADVLPEFPIDHPAFTGLIDQFKKLAEGIRNWQREGLWYQVTDLPGRKGNYKESSCSAMFAYALAKGAKMGFLDAEYADIARRAVTELLAQKVTVGEDGLPCLNDVCRVAGLGGAPYGDAKYRDGSFSYYIHEDICTDDYKGSAPFLMALSAIGL